MVVAVRRSKCGKVRAASVASVVEPAGGPHVKAGSTPRLVTRVRFVPAHGPRGVLQLERAVQRNEMTFLRTGPLIPESCRSARRPVWCCERVALSS